MPSSLYEVIENAWSGREEETALVAANETLKFRELERLSRNVAAFLVSIGISTSSRVIFYNKLSTQDIVCAMAVLRSGATIVTSFYGFGFEKLVIEAKNSEASVLVTNQDVDIKRLSEETGIRTYICINSCTLPSAECQYSFEEIVKAGEALPLNVNIDSCGIAAIFHTSGTTSNPKGVIITHENMLAVHNCVNSYMNLTHHDSISAPGNTASDLGFYNIFLPLAAGAKAVPYIGKLAPDEAAELVHANRVTGIQSVPSELYNWLCAGEFETSKYSTLRFISSTGQKLPQYTIDQIKTLFPDIPLISMYGMAECKRITYLHPDIICEKPASVGLPIPGVEALLIKDEKIVTEAHVVGELAVVSDMVMQGYWGNPSLSASKFLYHSHGYEKLLLTGDLFTRDEDGYLYYQGRKDEVFTMSTLKIDPLIVERSIRTHPEVVDAIVAAKDTIHEGAIPVAFVVLREGSSCSVDEIADWSKKTIDGYMVPKQIVLVPEIRRNTVGKPDKNALLASMN